MIVYKYLPIKGMFAMYLALIKEKKNPPKHASFPYLQELQFHEYSGLVNEKVFQIHVYIKCCFCFFFNHINNQYREIFFFFLNTIILTFVLILHRRNPPPTLISNSETAVLTFWVCTITICKFKLF